MLQPSFHAWDYLKTMSLRRLAVSSFALIGLALAGPGHDGRLSPAATARAQTAPPSTSAQASAAPGPANPLPPIPGCPLLVASGNPQYPPYLWRDPADEQKLVGANADLMQLLAKELGVAIDVKYGGSWARVQEEARLGRIDLVAGAFFTVPRLEYMDYVHPAFKETRTVIWTRADTKLPYRKWSDLVGLQGVTVINNSFGEEFDRYARESLKIATVSMPISRSTTPAALTWGSPPSTTTRLGW